MGAYVFPFRNYRSDEARWMSADPNGFPDGNNSRFYSPNPASQLDKFGLFLAGTPYSGSPSDMIAWNLYKNGAILLGYSLTLEALNRADGSISTGSEWTFTSTQSQSVKNSNLYQKTVYNDIQTFLDENATGSANANLTDSSLPHYHFNSSVDADLAYAVGGVNFSVTGMVTDLDGSWTYDGDVTFTKLYTFSTHNPVTDPHAYNRVGARLEAAGYIRAYNIKGTFKDSWVE